MSAHAFGWRRFGLLAGTGGGVLVLTSVLTAAFAFGDADDPLSGSDTAIILGGTFESTPSTHSRRPPRICICTRWVSTMARPPRRSATWSGPTHVPRRCRY